MPAEVYGARYRFLPRNDLLSYEEIARLARIFAQLGTRKIRITGGEPLLRAELPQLVARLSAIEGIEDLALTTNGFLLADAAASLAQAGLRRVTVSLDSLDEDVFRKMNGREHPVARVLEGIEAAQAAGLGPIKVNCVVQRGLNDHTLVDLAGFCRERGYTLRFIEYMDVGTLNGWNLTDVVPAEEILERIRADVDLLPLPPAYAGEVARRYRYADGSAEIGMIASVSKPFCGGCTRARLSTDGRLFTCLFSGKGTDLRTGLRSGSDDRELSERIRGVWQQRSDRYSEERASHTPESRKRRDTRKIEMFQVGG